MQSLKLLRCRKGSFLRSSPLGTIAERVLLPVTELRWEDGSVRAAGSDEGASCYCTTANEATCSSGRSADAWSSAERVNGKWSGDRAQPDARRKVRRAMAAISSCPLQVVVHDSPVPTIPPSCSAAMGGRITHRDGREGWLPPATSQREVWTIMKGCNQGGCTWGVRKWEGGGGVQFCDCADYSVVVDADDRRMSKEHVTYMSPCAEAAAARSGGERTALESAMWRRFGSGFPSTTAISGHVSSCRAMEQAAFFSRSLHSCSVARSAASQAQVISPPPGESDTANSSDDPVAAATAGEGGGGAVPNSNSKPAQSRWSLSMLVLILPCVATFVLGSWQLQRRQWKIDLLERRKERLRAEAEPLTDVLAAISSTSSSTSDDGQIHHLSSGYGGDEDATVHEKEWEPFEYRKVACEGVFDDRRSVFVGPRVRSAMGVPEKGYFLITPLILVDDNQGHGVVGNDRKESGRAGIVSSRSGSSSSGGGDLVGTTRRTRTWTVLVNRGWVPATWRTQFTSSQSQRSPSGSSADLHSLSSSSSSLSSMSSASSSSPRSGGYLSATHSDDDDGRQGICHVTGLIRLSERPSSFVPANSPENGQWFFIDVPAISRACGLAPNTPLMELVSSSSLLSAELDGEDDVDFPIRRSIDEVTKSPVMPRDHINYALTWYTLSAATSYMAWRMLRRAPPRRLRGSPSAAATTASTPRPSS